MNNFINTIFRMWNRFAAFLKSDIRNVESSFAAIEARLTNEIATLRQEVEQCRSDAANEIKRVDSDIAEHLEAVRFLDMSKRDGAGLRGERPTLLKQA